VFVGTLIFFIGMVNRIAIDITRVITPPVCLELIVGLHMGIGSIILVEYVLMLLVGLLG
jgi:hypothetical protein